MYNLLIVDDEPIIRRGIKSLAILTEIGISEIFEAGNAEKCLEIIDKEQIDIIMLDINMPNTDGLTLAKILNKVKWYKCQKCKNSIWACLQKNLLAFDNHSIK